MTLTCSPEEVMSEKRANEVASKVEMTRVNYTQINKQNQNDNRENNNNTNLTPLRPPKKQKTE